MPFIFYDRYMEMNVTCHNIYGGHNSDLLRFLINRPRFWAKHCKKKMQFAEDIDISDIKTTYIGGVFQVKSNSLDKMWYQVKLGDNDKRLPSCKYIA